jgi:hypothetical protein
MFFSLITPNHITLHCIQISPSFHYTTLHCTALCTYPHCTVLYLQMLHEAAFGEDSPLGGSLYAYNLNKLSVKDIMIFRRRNYNVGNLTGETYLLSFCCLYHLYPSTISILLFPTTNSLPSISPSLFFITPSSTYSFLSLSYTP